MIIMCFLLYITWNIYSIPVEWLHRVNYSPPYQPYLSTSSRHTTDIQLFLLINRQLSIYLQHALSPLRFLIFEFLRRLRYFCDQSLPNPLTTSLASTSYLPTSLPTLVTMPIGISKRHQFRNEKSLQDLIRTIPGNDRCADCQAQNPGTSRARN